jgi:hypothetical protein
MNVSSENGEDVYEEPDDSPWSGVSGSENSIQHPESPKSSMEDKIARNDVIVIFEGKYCRGILQRWKKMVHI